MCISILILVLVQQFAMGVSLRITIIVHGVLKNTYGALCLRSVNPLTITFVSSHGYKVAKYYFESETTNSTLLSSHRQLVSLVRVSQVQMKFLVGGPIKFEHCLTL